MLLLELVLNLDRRADYRSLPTKSKSRSSKDHYKRIVATDSTDAVGSLH